MLPELTALAARRRAEEHAGSLIAPLLGAAGDAIGEVLTSARERGEGAPMTGQELAAAANALMAAQPLEDADETTLETAAFAYAGALRAR
jgi:hypothetical protein